MYALVVRELRGAFLTCVVSLVEVYALDRFRCTLWWFVTFLTGLDR